VNFLNMERVFRCVDGADRDVPGFPHQIAEIGPGGVVLSEYY